MALILFRQSVNDCIKAILSGYMKKGSSTKRHTIEGIITPSEWDDDYNVTKVKVSLSGEKEYLLDIQSQGRELLNKTGRQLKATGRIQCDDDGNKIMTLDDYEIIDF